jgi:tetratricopeptide (TPR) repeat protein
MDNAIKYFKSRTEMEGWSEELWYSCLTLANCYIKIADIDNAIKLCNRAYEINKTRSEPLLLLSEIYENRGDNEEAMRYIEIGIGMKRNMHNILFTNDAVYQYAFFLSKFKLMLKNPCTRKRDVLESGMKLLQKLPKTNLSTVDFVVKVINQLSSPMDFMECPYDIEEKGLELFIEPCLVRVGTLSLEKLGSSYVIVEYGDNKRYSFPFVFMKTSCICRRFYRDEEGRLTFILQTHESLKQFKLKEDPELNEF